MDDVERENKRLQRRLDRERHARLDAEAIAERAIADLYLAVTTAELLGAISVIANEATSVADAMRGCLDRVCAHTGWPVGHALLVTPEDPPVAVSTGIWHLDDEARFARFRRHTEATRFSTGVGLPGRVLATGAPAWISSVAEDENFPRQRWAHEAGLEAGFAVPVMVRSDVRAVVEFFSTSVLSVDEGLLRVTSHVGAQLGRVIEREDAESKLTHQALHDTLTGLPNRALLMEHIERARLRAERAESTVDLLFLDVDDFKTVNDSLGHAAGDQLLVELSARLQGCLRRSDTLARPTSQMVARLGGDEFAVLLEDCVDPAVVAERIMRAFDEPIVVNDHEVFVAVSIGAARGGGHGDAEELLGRADVAMYAAKSGGKGRYEVFQPSMHAAVQRRHRLGSELRHAVAADQLRLVYQPVIELATADVVGVEALIRWEHPEHGLLAPGEFIGLAEESGLIVSIGEWVLREACREASHWVADRAAPTFCVAVNVSGRQLKEPGFVDVVHGALVASSLPPSCLCLEITESVLMENLAATADVLAAVKELGVVVAVDDFGTGYSSLASIGRYPVDYLKIDQSFVARLPDDADAGTIVWAVVRLGHNLGLRVVAEGVEDDAQLAALREMGCDLAQGFRFSRPLPAAELDAMLAGG